MYMYIYILKILYLSVILNGQNLFENTKLFKIISTTHYFDICFEGIQNCNRSSRLIKALTEVCHQIFGGWKVQIMWKLQ